MGRPTQVIVRGISACLVAACFAGAMQAQDDPVEPESVPLTDNNGGAVVLDAVGLLNKLPGTTIATTRDQSGQYHLNGTVLGDEIPPTSLGVHETKELGGTSDGFTSATETDAKITLSTEQLRRSAGKTAAVLLHELEHAALAKNHPIFAANCKACAEVVCAATAATKACALAQDCTNDLTPAERADVALGATQENNRCEANKLKPPPCNACTAPDMPDPIPNCPGPCSPANCD